MSKQRAKAEREHPVDFTAPPTREHVVGYVGEPVGYREVVEVLSRRLTAIDLPDEPHQNYPNCIASSALPELPE